MHRKIKINLFYLAAGIYLGIAVAAFIPWIEIGLKITAYSSIIALLITIYDSSKVSFKINSKQGDLRKERIHYVFMLAMRVLMIVSPFVLLFWINSEDDEEVIAKISNYVTFAAIGIVFFTRGMELKGLSSTQK
ncbi:hypothetical protein [Paenibacillus illinoisensis]|uniref:hypothetical protein n=1 Tax=Paenibacillus illinoisensis TaxID=59845 RepID=UPI00203F2B68|nr:hypothetical protein [Paenibacillus illinoisensis]MCM3203526.1 hypothetical protein [Paenibacillus illinoisensis]